MNVNSIGVIGAGIMGSGIAQALAQSNFDVILIDVDRAILKRAECRIRQGIRGEMLLKRKFAPSGSAEVLRRIEFSEDLQALEKADYVIENVVEKWETKRDLLRRVDDICPATCIFAANTSAIPITQIASATKREPQVIGIHFMNPVPVKPTVELIRGRRTSELTIRTTEDLLSRMGKQWVLVNDSPGFVSNRVLMLAVNEAICLVHEGVAPAEAVDKIFRECFGHTMGPLATADLIGLDTVQLSIEVLSQYFGGDKYTACPLLKEMVADGRLGRKTGRGFYEYEGNDEKHPDI